MKRRIVSYLVILIIIQLIIRFRAKFFNVLLKNKKIRYYTLAYVNEWDTEKHSPLHNKS